MKLFDYFFIKVEYKRDLLRVMFVLLIFPSFFSAQDFSENVTETMHVAPGTLVFNANDEQLSTTDDVPKKICNYSEQVKLKKVLKRVNKTEKVLALKRKDLKDKKESIQPKVKIFTFYSNSEDSEILAYHTDYSHSFVLPSFDKKIKSKGILHTNYFGQQSDFDSVSNPLFVNYLLPHLENNVNTYLFSRPPPSSLS